jgi:hypothetical protein
MIQDEKIVLFLALWAASVLFFFSISARLEHYGLPAYPALAAMIGLVLARANEERRERELRLAVLPILIIGLIVAIGISGFLIMAVHKTANAQLLDGNDKLTFFSPMGGFSKDTLFPMRTELVECGIGFLLMGVLGYAAIRKERVPVAAAGMVLGIVFVIAAIQSAEEHVSPYLTSKPLAVKINENWKPGDMIVIEGEFFNMSSVGFYTRKPVYRWRGHPEWEFGSRFGNARSFYLNDSEFSRIWQSNKCVFLIGEERRLRSVGFLKSNKIIGKTGTTILLTNKER